MKTYKIEYDSSAGPEDAMAGRAWDVIEMVDGRTTNIIASRCTGENAERIMRCLNAGDRAYAAAAVLAEQKKAERLRAKLQEIGDFAASCATGPGLREALAMIEQMVAALGEQQP